MAQVRGEWKLTAYPIVKRVYFDALVNGNLASQRQAYAKWLLGDNDSSMDAFVFGDIVYNEEVRLFHVYYV